jgi:hypothetical protein
MAELTDVAVRVARVCSRIELARSVRNPGPPETITHILFSTSAAQGPFSVQDTRVRQVTS